MTAQELSDAVDRVDKYLEFFDKLHKTDLVIDSITLQLERAALHSADLRTLVAHARGEE